MMTIRRAILFTFLTAFALSGTVHGQTCTPVTSVPVTITTPGVHCFTGNLTFTGLSTDTAITVSNSSVVLDLAGFRLWYQGAGDSSAPGIDVGAQVQNVVVRNGLVSGFGTGVRVQGDAVIVEDLRIHRAEDDFASSTGIETTDGADDAVIRRNYIRTTRTGVIARGPHGRILDNNFFGGDTTYYDGIWVFGTDAQIVGNRFGRLDQAINFTGAGTGKYRDNLTTNVGRPYTAGTDAGNNN